MENKTGIDNTQLMSIIERVEKLNEEMAEIAADVKEVYAEAKSAGFDPKYIKKVIKARKLDPDQLDEQNELLKMYGNAAGIQLTLF